MTTSPPVPPSPLPPSPSLDVLPIPPPIPPVINIPVPPIECYDFIPDDSSLDIFPPIDPFTQLGAVPPLDIVFPDSPDKCYTRGRSRSRSRSPSPSRSRSPSSRRIPSPVSIPQCGTRVYMSVPSLYDTGPCGSYTPSSSRSPSPPRRRRRYSYRSRTPSPIRQPYTYTPPRIIYPPPPPQMMSPPMMSLPMMSAPSITMTPPPPIPVWPPSQIPIQDPVDILTFHYNKSMAYAPAAKTYDEAMDNVLELWPDLREFDRDRIHLFVGGADQLVRVPKMAWQLVMCDLPRYEIMHIQVDQLPPPPQYQSDGKVNLEIGDEKKEKKPARSGGFFSSIKRIFWR